MKNFFVTCFFLFVLSLYSQTTKSLLFLDLETNKPIEDVSVLIVKGKQLFLSNSEGITNIDYTGNTTIQIVHTSYESKTIRTITLKDNITTVYLKSIVNALEEIIITNQHPQKILKTLIDNSVSKLSIPSKLKVYSREFFKINGKYSNYNDGLLNFQLSGEPKKVKTDVLVEQNRSYGLVNENINDYLLGYNLNNIMENYYRFKYLEKLLDAKAKKEFDFIVKSYVDNADYYKMVITPNQESKGVDDDYTIIYDRKKKMIIEVSSILSENILARIAKKNSVGSENIKKSYFKTVYKIDNANYYLINSKEEVALEKIKRDETYTIEVRSYFVTLNFSKQKFSFKQEDVFKDKSLFNKKNTILSNYWNYAGLSATDEEQEIISEIQLE